MLRRKWLGRAPLGLPPLVILTAALFSPAQTQPPDSNSADTGYVDDAVCGTCHKQQRDTYSKTGMARSFYRPGPENTVEDYTRKNSFYHAASNTWFEMIKRGGKYFQREYQIDFDGKQTNVLEKQIDYIVGSGNHARTYLSRTARNALIELPLGWYAEKGGYWAMNPGYDRPDHPGLRRHIDYDCFYCHNAYPRFPTESAPPGNDAVFPASLAEGIDCQRCHGPGRKHVQASQRAGAGNSASNSEVRASIVNPARLTPQLQMDVCRQCHLETTSSPLPNSIVRYERGPFSYRPGEPLADFKLFFDRKVPGDRVEIASAAYRLDRSACFLKSGGRMTCTTCHNPHDIRHGEEGARHYTAVCRTCHAADFNRLVATGKHSPSNDCIACHMPKRRTDDVVHAVMTDHYIQRRKPARDLLAAMPEALETGAAAYRGEVALYYPASDPRPEDELYFATAQVIQGSNPSEGIPRLAAAIAKYKPERYEHYLQLGDALRNSGKCAEALPWYGEAQRRSANAVSVIQKTALCLESSGKGALAAEILKKHLELSPDDATTWAQLGVTYAGQGRAADGVSAFERATEADPELPEEWNGLGGILTRTGNVARAEAALRNALRLQPNYAEAHNNLAGLLSTSGRFEEARYHFEAALRYKADYNFARYNYGIALGRENRFKEAREQFEAALRSDPNSADAHEVLGMVLSAAGDRETAMEHYREALRIRPDFDRANLSLGSALADSGDRTGALSYLRRAAESPDKDIREEALRMLRDIEKPR